MKGSHVSSLLAAATLIILFHPLQTNAQDMDSLNLQFHGFATQSFVKTTNNNWNTLNTKGGSAAWTEAVINISSTPDPKLRIAVQGRYFLLGTIGNSITLDWATADYKLNEKLGFRVGKVKSPAGMLNEEQDIDPAEQWILMPQSIYSIASRNSTLSHFGGVFYGTEALGEKGGKLQYRSYGGQRVINGNDGLYQSLRDRGFTLPNGSTGPMYGGMLNYFTPLKGWMVGGSIDSEHTFGAINSATNTGFFKPGHFYQPYLYSRYDRGKLQLGGEYSRQALVKTLAFNGVPPSTSYKDQRSFYGYGIYHVTNKLSGGLCYSSAIDVKQKPSAAKYQKDWTLSVRYDVNTFLYAKAEEHILDGTYLGYSTSNSATGLLPNDKMTMLKMGVSF
jgi:hypothetical protein